MNAFAYKGAMYCAGCAADIKAALEKTTGMPPLELRESSDHWPQGPLANGGGEADTPQHCDSCGEFLENVLTPDGDSYVREQLSPYEGKPGSDSWEEVAQRAESSGHPTLAQWARFYFAPGQ